MEKVKIMGFISSITSTVTSTLLMSFFLYLLVKFGMNVQTEQWNDSYTLTLAVHAIGVLFAALAMFLSVLFVYNKLTDRMMKFLTILIFTFSINGICTPIRFDNSDLLSITTGIIGLVTGALLLMYIISNKIKQNSFADTDN